MLCSLPISAKTDILWVMNVAQNIMKMSSNQRKLESFAFYKYGLQSGNPLILTCTPVANFTVLVDSAYR